MKRINNLYVDLQAALDGRQQARIRYEGAIARHQNLCLQVSQTADREVDRQWNEAGTDVEREQSAYETARKTITEVQKSIDQEWPAFEKLVDQATTKYQINLKVLTICKNRGFLTGYRM